MTKQEEIREGRRKKTAEIFTPPELVNEMLDKLPNDIWQENKTFCDPATGNGNILLEILRRKLKLGHDPIQALRSIWGVELMPDNVKECKERLLDLIPADLHKEAKTILNHNIKCHDALTWDFEEWKSKEVSKYIRKVI
jgi:type I restriction-modification system DNA methylase subunit